MMVIYIIKNGKIETFSLPQTVSGSYWIFDCDIRGDKRSLLNVSADNNAWKINSNTDVKIISVDTYLDSTIISNNSFLEVQIVETKEKILLYCFFKYDNTYIPYIVKNNTLTIGKNEQNNISYNSPLLRAIETTITYDGKFKIASNHETSILYVNKALVNSAILTPGDIVFIMGLKIICMGDFLVINNPHNIVRIDSNSLIRKEMTDTSIIPINLNEEIVNAENEMNYFFRAPRFRSIIEPMTIRIDPPPPKPEEEKNSILLTLGPMITMGLVSFISLFIGIVNLLEGASLLNVMPTIAIGVSMLFMSLIWPSLNAKFQKKTKAKREDLRQKKYTKYINKKAEQIQNIITVQKNILNENNVPLDECQSIILNKKRNLWERKIEHDDFLKVRLGTGSIVPQIKIDYPEERFELFDDNLLSYMRGVIGELNEITNVPVTLSLTEKFITAVVGPDWNMVKNYIDLLIFQLVTHQSYEDIKLVILTDENNKNKWDYLKKLPHLWSNDNSVRYFGTNSDEIKLLSSYLELEFNSRFEEKKKIQTNNDVKIYKKVSPYYIIITDSLSIVRNTDIIHKVLSQKENFGFSIIIQNDKLSDLPNECFSFVNVDKTGCGIFENDLVSNKQSSFVPITSENIDFDKCYESLANIKVKLNKGKTALAKTIGFLEMYEVGNIEQLNILNKWKNNNPTLSLNVPLGMDENGELFKLDLHEKFHGPHGLIAGMTGSGKSELIITYMLSAAINFHPDELSFVVIDYKGGGLAGAFFNKETGVKLPHLIGTITNLDTSEMNRFTASLDSELKRRQVIFNETRDKFNESTIDIYKYQRLYREKKLIFLFHI